MKQLHSGVLPGSILEPNRQFLERLFLALDRCSYWKRTWTVQEFISAKDLLILYGDVCVSWSSLAWFIHAALTNPDDPRSASTNSPSNPRSWELCQQRLHRSTEHYLFHLIVKNRRRHCSDRHDKVYALLSLVSDFDPLSTSQEYQPDVQYSSGLDVLFTDVWNYIATDSLAVHPGDVMAYACALKRILGLDSYFDSLPHVCDLSLELTNALLIPLIHAECYITGKVIHVQDLKTQRSVQLTSASPSSQWVSLQKQLKVQESPSQWSDKALFKRITSYLSWVSPLSIYVPPGLLHVVNKRMAAGSDEYLKIWEDLLRSVPHFSYVVIELEQLRAPNPRYAVGLACGNACVGDTIIQFSKYDVAFTACDRSLIDGNQEPRLEKRAHANPKYSLTAKLVYIEKPRSWTSELTEERFYFEGLRAYPQRDSGLESLLVPLHAENLLALASRWVFRPIRPKQGLGLCVSTSEIL